MQIVLRTERDKQTLIQRIANLSLPSTVSITDGEKRSLAQNRLQRLWINELAEQGDLDAESYRAICKLHVGVPILRNESDEFKARYDSVFKVLPYETKIELMKLPFDFPVTRLMTTKQKKHYLDQVHLLWSQQGFFLTDPDRFMYEQN